MKFRMIALAPWLVFQLLFFSLAWHMKNQLGFWPPNQSYELTGTLFFHASIVTNMFSLLIVFTMLCIPIGFLIGFSKSKNILSFSTWYSVGIAATLFLMRLAPDGFSYWWWD